MNLTEIVIIIINSIATALGFSGFLYSIYYILSKNRCSFIKLFTVLCISCIIVCCVAITYLPIVLFAVSFIYLYINKASHFLNILSCMIATAFFMLVLVLDNTTVSLIQIPAERIFELRHTIFYNLYNSILYISFSFIIILIVNAISNHFYNINCIDLIAKVPVDNKLIGFISTIIIFTVLIISTIWLVALNDKSHAVYYIVFGNILSFVTVVFALLSVYFVIRLIKQKAHEVEVQKDKEIAELYKNEISAMYDNIRDFKHDYMKIFSSVSVLLEQNRIDELKTYFNSEILSLHDKTLSDFNNDIHTLTNITDSIVQGVIYSYIIKAKHMNINLSIDIQEKIHQHPDISSLDMSRIFGILLDNAFEAAGETNDKIVLFGAGISGSQTIYVVKNQYSVPPDISKIFNTEYSTKGDEHGRGLFIAKKITDKYDNVFFNISLQDGWFVSEIIVEQQKQ